MRLNDYRGASLRAMLMQPRSCAPCVRITAGGARVFGATGALMREAGVEAIVHSDDLAIMGLAEIAGALPKFWRAFQALKRAALGAQARCRHPRDWLMFTYVWLVRFIARACAHLLHQPQLWRGAHRIRSIRRDVVTSARHSSLRAQWYEQRASSCRVRRSSARWRSACALRP